MLGSWDRPARNSRVEARDVIGMAESVFFTS